MTITSTTDRIHERVAELRALGARAEGQGWTATGASTTAELEVGRHTPVGRPGTPDEIASLAAYLCCESAGYLTGQSIVVDSGNMIQEPHGVELY